MNEVDKEVWDDGITIALYFICVGAFGWGIVNDGFWFTVLASFLATMALLANSALAWPRRGRHDATKSSE